MGQFAFNIAKGRIAEFYNRVKTQDPSTCRLVIVPLELTGLEVQASLEDSENLAEILNGTTNEQITIGRKYLVNTDLAALVADMVNNRMDVDIPNIIWYAATGNQLGAIVICYDPNSSIDSAIIPLSYHDWSIIPDGSDIEVVVPTAGFFRAS
jgi:hypothetical protein